MDNLLLWIVVGVVAGFLASRLAGGGGLGLIGNLVVGVAGALVGSWLFRSAGWQAPFGGLAGVIAVATIGAVLLLVVVRIVYRGSDRL